MHYEHGVIILILSNIVQPFCAKTWCGHIYHCLTICLHVKSSHFNRNVCNHEFLVRTRDSHTQILQCSALVTWFDHVYLQKAAWFEICVSCDSYIATFVAIGSGPFFTNASVTSLLYVGCGVCKRMQPIFQQAATETKGKYVSTLLACQNHGLLIPPFPFFLLDCILIHFSGSVVELPNRWDVFFAKPLMSLFDRTFSFILIRGRSNFT